MPAVICETISMNSGRFGSVHGRTSLRDSQRVERITSSTSPSSKHVDAFDGPVGAVDPVRRGAGQVLQFVGEDFEGTRRDRGAAGSVGKVQIANDDEHGNVPVACSSGAHDGAPLSGLF